jgi:hypothetical protein
MARTGERGSAGIGQFLEGVLIGQKRLMDGARVE